MSSQDKQNPPVCQLPVNDRVEKLRNVFEQTFDGKVEFFVRVPGRVNLIGEHIDYCGYGVCPMALQQDILLAVSTQGSDTLKLHNLDTKHPPVSTNLRTFTISVVEGGPQWHQYFLCGVRGILDNLNKDAELVGMNILVSGTIPQSAGLSSSSALVCSAALATAYANNVSLSKQEIADICAKCERYIGTQGGGMDQAIAFLASEGCAKFIEFSPLRSRDLVLPTGAVFVIAHSMAKLNKAATADYNCRVVECRLAAQIIAKKKGIEWHTIKRLGDIHKALCVDLEQMLSTVESIFHEEPYTKEEVLRELETSSDSLEVLSLTPNTKHLRAFKLRQRALHVFQEALRVEKFHNLCSNATGDGTLEALGQLMTESHESLRDLYECSHPQLDRIVEISKGLALGCRLTGAGWGGCTVALVHPENVDKYINALKDTFYKELGIVDHFESIVFATAPNAGACIYLENAAE